MEWWTQLTEAFTTEDWFSLWSLVVAVLAIAANIWITVWNSRRVGSRLKDMNEATDGKLEDMDTRIAKGLASLDDKVNGIDWNHAYILGVLDGAGIAQGTRRKGTRQET